MEYYAKYSFKKSESSNSSFELVSHEGKDIESMKLEELKTKKGKFINLSIPKSLSMRRYFAYTFQIADKQVLTSVEALKNFRTFGDAKNIGENAVLLFQFSPDLTQFDIYFVRVLFCSKTTKQETFNRWIKGENLVKSVA